VERNRKAGQNPPRVVAPIEEEEEEVCPNLRGERLSRIQFPRRKY